MLLRARNVSLQANQVGSIPLQVSAKAIFNNEVQVTGFSGTWVGQLKVGGTTTSLNGSAVGAPPAPTTDTEAK